MLRTLVLTISISLSLTPYPAFGWGDLGHQTVAAIAELKLTPRAKDFVADLLREPLPVAATFPDQVRSDKRYNGFAPYHFFTIPLGKNFEELTLKDLASKSAHTMLTIGPRMVQSSANKKTLRSLWLKYIIHIAGDVHQPLHVGNEWDMGANLCNITWIDPETKLRSIKNLHSIWDENLLDYFKVDYTQAHQTDKAGKRYYGYNQLVELLTGKFSGQFNEEAKAPVGDWYQESMELHDQVYPDGEDKKVHPKDRTYCKILNQSNHQVEEGKYDETTLPVIDEAYARRALDIIEKRLYLGGLRLAHLINSISEKTEPPKFGAKQFEAELEQAQIQGY